MYICIIIIKQKDMSDFKVGQIVTVSASINHKFESGTIGEIVGIDSTSKYIDIEARGFVQSVKTNLIQKTNNMKNLLETGVVVELLNGALYFTISDALVAKSGFLLLEHYDDNGKNLSSSNDNNVKSGWDIKKVYAKSLEEFKFAIPFWFSDLEDREVIWEAEEEEIDWDSNPLVKSERTGNTIRVIGKGFSEETFNGVSLDNGDLCDVWVKEMFTKVKE